MKYIKLFEGFDQYDFWNYGSMKKIKQDINDMFIGLIDDGYEVDVKIIGTLQVYIEGKWRFVGFHDWFFFDEISDTVSMLIEYVESEFDDVKVTFSYERYNSSFEYIKQNKQEVMDFEDKHFLVSYFSIEFETGNKKL